MAMENPPFKNLVRWFSHLEASIYIYIVWHSLGISQVAMFDDTMMRKSIDIQWSCHFYPFVKAWLRTFLKTSISRNTSYQLPRNPSTYQPGVAAAAGIHLRWFKDFVWLLVKTPHSRNTHRNIINLYVNIGAYTVCMSIYMYYDIHVHIHVYIYICDFKYVHTYIHIHTHIYV
jgi:hypothetical protein